MDVEWEMIVTATIAVVGSIAVAIFGFISTSTRNLIDGLTKRVEQVEKRNVELEKKTDDQQLEIEQLIEARKDDAQRHEADELYIAVLQGHIIKQLPPPPPERPRLE